MPHIHEKIDFTATAYIVFQNKVLLHHHKKYHFWLGVGGHVELDENPNQTLIREAKEESGLDINILDPHKTKIPLKDYDPFESLIAPAFLSIHQINNMDHQHIDMVYFAIASSDKFTPEEEKIVLKWFSEEELTDKQYNIAESIIFYSKEALKAANSKN